MRNPLFKILLVGVAALSLSLSLVLVESEAQAADDSAQPQPDPMQFVRGAKSWANNCARCHNMRDPKELRDDQWRAVVMHMRVRAGLTGDEARDVLAFLEGSN